MKIRHIQPGDNKQLAHIIRTSLKEYTDDLEGTVYYDDTTDHLYELFQTTNSVYYIVEEDGLVLGGCGLYPTEGLAEDTVELVKMYLQNESRGKGIGLKLLQNNIAKAKELGFNYVYLETLPILESAIHLYEKFGFTHLTKPLGNSGHHGCDVWMIYKIK